MNVMMIGTGGFEAMSCGNYEEFRPKAYEKATAAQAVRKLWLVVVLEQNRASAGEQVCHRAGWNNKVHVLYILRSRRLR